MRERKMDTQKNKRRHDRAGPHIHKLKTSTMRLSMVYGEREGRERRERGQPQLSIQRTSTQGGEAGEGQEGQRATKVYASNE